MSVSLTPPKRRRARVRGRVGDYMQLTDVTGETHFVNATQILCDTLYPDDEVTIEYRRYGSFALWYVIEEHGGGDAARPAGAR